MRRVLTHTHSLINQSATQPLARVNETSQAFVQTPYEWMDGRRSAGRLSPNAKRSFEWMDARKRQAHLQAGRQAKRAYRQIHTTYTQTLSVCPYGCGGGGGLCRPCRPPSPSSGRTAPVRPAVPPHCRTGRRCNTANPNPQPPPTTRTTIPSVSTLSPQHPLQNTTQPTQRPHTTHSQLLTGQAVRRTERERERARGEVPVGVSCRSIKRLRATVCVCVCVLCVQAVGIFTSSNQLS
mmetsp:Transcript_23655/g.67984  ORF Transcript_23655/g.67984 Transcript_23655/m.67984 type:complete len:237 (-) Transcript_23655:168-878(-)